MEKAAMTAGDSVRCTLPKDGFQARQEVLRASVFCSVTAAEETRDGYTLTFPPGSEKSVQDFVAAERRCCGFMTFTVDNLGGDILLGISGPQGTKPFIRQMMPSAVLDDGAHAWKKSTAHRAFNPPATVVATLLALSAFVAVPATSAVDIGNEAPEFHLPTYSGEEVSLSDYADEIVVLEWFAHDCEFTGNHYRKGDGHMQKLQREFVERGVVWLTIDSNQNALPTSEMVALAEDWKMKSTAFLSDRSGTVGRTYGVTNTPQMFVIDHGTLVYQGAIDDRSSFFSFLRDRSTALNYVRQALDELFAGKPVSTPETKPYGCKINYAD